MAHTNTLRVCCWRAAAVEASFGKSGSRCVENCEDNPAGDEVLAGDPCNDLNGADLAYWTFSFGLLHVRGRILLRWFGQKCATEVQRITAVPVCEKPEVTDLYEASWQNMQQESSNEFDCVDGHELLAISIRGVSPTKGYIAMLQANQPTIGDGHTMRVAGEVAGLRSRKQQLYWASLQKL